MNEIINNQEIIDYRLIREMLEDRNEIKLQLSNCVSCGLCAESCFYYKKTKDPQSTPSFKAINSLGLLYKKKGKISIHELVQIKELLWGKCVLCGQCVCPLGVNIPSILAWGRSICRSQGIFENYFDGPLGV